MANSATITTLVHVRAKQRLRGREIADIFNQMSPIERQSIPGLTQMVICQPGVYSILRQNNI